ncbi:MAG TPA: methyltransferase domain-containing protein [Candidatus Nitrosotalea sp.]|nr:methyltransferase domain-containing protein [Candidatus Nitrosotalea sp.]
MLDVGAGNHSATLTTKWLPRCSYYGIDRSRAYNNDQTDFDAMQNFWEMDLTSLAFDDIPDDFFDALVMSHVVEHLRNAHEVIIGLIPKLKLGGLLYIETPDPRSAGMPSMNGTLNFFDDETHVHLFNLRELYNVILPAGCTVIRSGRRRDPWRVVLSPSFAIYRRVRTGRFLGGDFWDLFGFADYVVARRTSK